MLIDNLITLRGRLGSIPQKLGHHAYREVWVSVNMTAGAPYTLLVPKLRVTQIETARVGTWLTDSIQVLGTEILVSGVPRTYPLAALEGKLYRIDGVAYRCLYIDTKELLTWTLTLSKIS